MKPVDSLQELSDLFQVSRRTATSWARKYKSCSGDGPFDPEGVAKETGRPVPEGAKPGIESEAQKLKRAQRLLTDSRTEAQNYKNAIERGELVHVGDTEEALLDQATIFRRELLGMKDHFADSFIGLETREKVQEQFDRVTTDILGRLSKGE